MRYSSELTAKITTPPAETRETAGHRRAAAAHIAATPRRRRRSPMGLGTASAWVQSKGRLLRDQMTGWTFCMMLREMATMLQVSWRTATRLRGGTGDASHPRGDAAGGPPGTRGAHPGQVWLGSKRMRRVGS